MKPHILLLVIVFLVSACQPTTLPPDAVVTNPPVEEPVSTQPTTGEEPSVSFNPQPSDNKLERGNIFIEESGLLIRESFPPQIALSITGNLPTPCHQLRVKIEAPDAENKIIVEGYTVTDPNMICVQVLAAFSQTIELGMFPTGHYTVWLNGEMVGEFDS